MELFKNALQTIHVFYCYKPEEFENEAFGDDDVIFLPRFSSNTNPKWSLIVAFSKLFGIVDGNSVLNFKYVTCVVPF